MRNESKVECVGGKVKSNKCTENRIKYSLLTIYKREQTYLCLTQYDKQRVPLLPGSRRSSQFFNAVVNLFVLLLNHPLAFFPVKVKFSFF